MFRGDVPFRLESKSGFIVKIERDGIISYGDVSPLVGQNSRLYKDVLAECKNINTTSIFADIEKYLKKHKSQFLEEKFLDIDFSSYCNSTALKFALSCLFSYYYRQKFNLNLNGVVLYQGLITDLSSTQDAINTAKELSERGFEKVKVKIGAGYPQHDLEIENKALKEIIRQTDLSLRLDANRKLHLDDYEILLKDLDLDRIEYVEEPLRHSPDLLKFTNTHGLNVAIDENMTLMKDIVLDGVNTIILKPTLVGDYYSLKRIIEKFHRRGMSPVLSSSFESHLGLYQIAELALALNPRETHGLGTINAFLEELVEIKTKSGQIIIEGPIELKGPIYV